jgi:hypothetical protein
MKSGKVTASVATTEQLVPLMEMLILKYNFSALI